MGDTIKSHLDELIEKRQQISDNLDTMVQGDFNPEGDEFKGLQREAEDLEKRIEAVKKSIDLRTSANSLAHRMGSGPLVPTANSEMDLGSQLIQSEQFKIWKRSGAAGRAHLMEIPIGRALIDTSSISQPKDRIYAAQPAQQTSLLNTINKIQTSNGAVEVITYPAADPLAGIVAEGAQKPEATFTFGVTTFNLQTLAHWVEATRQIIEDEVRLRDFLSNSLLRGVMDKAESEAAGVVTGGTYQTASSDSMLHALRIGIAYVNDAGYRPNAILLNPLDAADLDYEVWSGTNGGGGAGSVWGTPVVANSAIAAGSAFVADFNVAFHHYYRGTADLFVTDSDVGMVAAAPVSNFKRNVLTFLAEYRCKTALIRPEAVVEVSVTGTPLTASQKPGPKTSGSGSERK